MRSVTKPKFFSVFFFFFKVKSLLGLTHRLSSFTDKDAGREREREGGLIRNRLTQFLRETRVHQHFTILEKLKQMYRLYFSTEKEVALTLSMHLSLLL